MVLQEKYWNWHREGLDIAHEFVQECKEMSRAILAAFGEDNDPAIRCLAHIPIDDHDTFESVWFDDQGRLCCAAMIDDGAPMGWYVEFLDLCSKQALHALLRQMRNEYLKPNASNQDLPHSRQ